MNSDKLLTELITDENREAIKAFTAFAGPAVTVGEVPPLLEAFGQWAVANRIGPEPDSMATAVAAVIRLEPMPRLKLKTLPAPKSVKRQSVERKPKRPKLPAFELDDSPGTLWHLFKTSYRLRELRGGSERTAMQYQIQLRHFGRYLGHQPTLADLDEDTVSAFLDHHAKDRTPCTVNKAHWALIALWQHAAKKRLVETFPTIAPLDEPSRIPQAWTIEELARLLAACRQQPGTIADVNAANWWYAMCLFAFTTGERTGAVLSIRLSDVNFDRGEVLIPAEVRKGKKRDMLYRLRPETLEAISTIREPDRTLLFAFDAEISTFYNRFTRILKRAGLPHYKCKLQKLRRTFASYVEAGGGDATKALAHSNRSIAIKSYLDPRVVGGAQSIRPVASNSAGGGRSMTHNPSLLLSEFFDTVYRPMRLLAASGGTLQQYRIAIHAIEKHLGRPPLVSDLNCGTVVAFMEAEQKRGMAVATVNARLTHLFALARLVRKRGYFETDIHELQKLKEKRPAPVAWTEQEMELLISSCRLARGRFMGIPAALWWESFVLVLYDSGIRRSAAMQIRFEEIDFATGMLRVPAERMKNGVEQFFKLHTQTIEVILSTLPPRRKLVFPWPFYHQHALYGRFKVILRRAGLPFGKKDMFHKIRRTTASHTARLLGEGIASMQLGHQDGSTIKRYIDPRFTARHDAADVLPRPGWVNPREITVTVHRESATAGEPETVEYSLADLRGDGDDVFSRLAETDDLSPDDIKAALDSIGMQAKELAEEIGLAPWSFARMLRGKRPLSADLASRIRGALGISFNRNGEAGAARKAVGA